MLLAGGKGTRMQSVVPKQFLKIKGRELALFSFECLLNHPFIQEMVVVCAEEFRPLFTSTSKNIQFADPGPSRQLSVYNGLKKVSTHTDFVCIHDSARPCLNAGLITRVCEGAFTFKAAALGVPATNTLKEVDESKRVIKTLDRSKIWEVQTPQVIEKDLLLKGYQILHNQNLEVTDDISIVELMGIQAQMVPSQSSNLKLTTPSDLPLIENLMGGSSHVS